MRTAYQYVFEEDIKKNKGSKKGRIIKKIGLVLMGIDLLHLLIIFLLNKDSPEPQLIILYIIYVVLPILSIGLILFFWGRYIQFKTRKGLIIALVITVILSLFILQCIIWIFSYYE